jgi:hypothetical protein
MALLVLFFVLFVLAVGILRHFFPWTIGAVAVALALCAYSAFGENLKLGDREMTALAVLIAVAFVADILRGTWQVWRGL